MYLFPDIKRNDIWKKGYNKLTKISVDGNKLFYENIRNMDHKIFEENYFNETFNLEKLDKIILHSIPFGLKKWFSHLILEFIFLDGKKIFLSVEARRQPGEGFSILKGLIPHYGLIFIWGTENDLIGLRRNIRKNKIFSWELNIDKQKAKEGLLYFIKRTNKLIEKPEFYNVFLSNCTTNLYDVLKNISEKNIKFSWEIILSAFIDRYLEKYNLVKK